METEEWAMARRIPYLDRKGAIIATLTQCARQRRTIYYGELGQRVDVPARGPWKAILDDIARDETSEGRPDITFLVINRKTGFPGQIGFKTANPPTFEQRKIADDEIAKVFAYYG
jgi:hypothetical protein